MQPLQFGPNHSHAIRMYQSSLQHSALIGIRPLSTPLGDLPDKPTTNSMATPIASTFCNTVRTCLHHSIRHPLAPTPKHSPPQHHHNLVLLHPPASHASACGVSKDCSTVTHSHLVTRHTSHTKKNHPMCHSCVHCPLSV